MLSADVAPYRTVHCTLYSDLCNDDQPFVVIVTGSNDVVLHYEDAGTPGSGDVARIPVKGIDSGSVAQLISIDGLPVLELSATNSKLNVVLLRKERVQRIVNQGSGKVTVNDYVLATNGPSLTVSSIDNGDMFLTASTPIEVDELSLSAQGSGNIQASFSEFDVKTVSAKVASSADMTVLAASQGSADSLTLSVQGSGSLCLSAGSSIETNGLIIKKVGTGDISIGPGSCKTAELTTTGSGTIDAGGIQCVDVNVDLLGSGNVFVQATDSLSGDVYGSGKLRYFGNAPHSIDNINYLGLVTALPASSSYHPSECKVKPFPSSKAKASASVGKELSYDVDMDKGHIIYLGVVVFIVALVLRWFNESRRRSREERQPLVGANRLVYV
ncbi:hypothetical protein P3T76_009095 [Phytophthora citrophthora]|uniref:Putative auto-transporter adhesin head GIN domain-containing protein n=1 Tax=Phytophthora citrophthora TaxID=4793 RepID=A0AAD9LJQ1_9STRA|nr:hypothetical protein P3T76_009095 [Phytophthora citrophthora]